MARTDPLIEPLHLSRIFEKTWADLSACVSQTDHPFRTPVLATSCPYGVDQRTVVLRRVSQAGRELDFHTDGRSAKVDQLRQSANASWLFYNCNTGIQVRLASTARLHQCDEETLGLWANVPAHSRLNYGGHQTPGAIWQPQAATQTTPDSYEHFILVRCTVHQMDWLRIRGKLQQRARFIWNNTGWQGTQIVP